MENDPYAKIRVLDDTGSLIQLPGPARRIVSLAPHITELVYAAGAGRYLIATDHYSDYPEGAKTLPRIGASGGIDRERLLQLQPDLVIAWQSGNKATDLRWLQGIGIPVYRSEHANLRDIGKTLRDIGVMADTLDPASRAADAFHRRLADACPRTPNQPLQPTYYEIWHHPAMTIGGHHWLNDVLRHAGMENVFADQPRAILNIEAEAALSRPYRRKIVDSTQTAAQAQSGVRQIPGNPLLGRPGPRIAQGIAKICQ